MIFHSSFKEFLKEKTGKSYFDSGNNNIITFCPWCEKDRFFSNAKGHCTISVHDPIFNCFKCESGHGIVTKLIKKLGESPDKFLIDTNFKTYKKTNKIKNYEIPEIKLEEDKENSKYILKSLYIQSRIGTEANLSKIPNLVFDIKKFINDNHVKLSPSHVNLVDYFEENFVGFVTNMGSLLVLRNIDSSSDFRYFNIHINQKSFLKDFYGITTNKIQKDNTIVLCEGIFDLLVGMNDYSMLELKNKSCLWASVLTSKYNNVILSVLNYCKLPKANFVILVDNVYNSNDEPIYKDELLKDIENVKRNISVSSLQIYSNKYGKDFGSKPIAPVKSSFNISSKGYFKNGRRRSF